MAVRHSNVRDSPAIYDIFHGVMLANCVRSEVAFNY
ncbi:hypothetical protein TSAR_014754 [Trichomalopsis sarcophagae]|uniref:Uncharacterized protein n=1 Tax=Trichomalopsis sarcophagae TaxID=543379 RepID=A0A232EFE7_9HYME|nr:hypothetical protein TSAR_014754 [Trichomalopsis sarcophagae]